MTRSHMLGTIGLWMLVFPVLFGPRIALPQESSAEPGVSSVQDSSVDSGIGTPQALPVEPGGGWPLGIDTTGFVTAGMHPLQAEALSLENVRKRAQIEGLRLRNRRYGLGNQWAFLELKSFNRHVYALARDERRLLQRRRVLLRQRQALLAFVNGESTSRHRALVKRVIAQTPQSFELARLLQYRIPPLPADSFSWEADCLESRVLRPDGSLWEPPVALLERDQEDVVGRHRRDVTRHWAFILAALKGNRFSDVRVGYPALELAVKSWSESSRPTRYLASGAEQKSATSYISGLQTLINRLKSPRTASALSRSIFSRHFNGGTLAELIDHIDSQRLCPKRGTKGQLSISEAGKLWLESVDQELVALSRRLEDVRQRNPAHTAALRETIRPERAADTGFHVRDDVIASNTWPVGLRAPRSAGTRVSRMGSSEVVALTATNPAAPREVAPTNSIGSDGVQRLNLLFGSMDETPPHAAH